MKKTPRKIELLAPAKDLDCGLEAINHGADAVYIGAPKFSARAAAGNTVEDIRRLCNHAHLYDARVYVAFNTILFEDELKEAEKLIRDLYQAGADALIVQDMGILKMELPPIALHASTQTDNRTPEKVKFLHSAGFSQVVLARELTLDEIRTILEETDVPLEVFIHGALCVSYSGQCYLSAALGGRSANRGACAQYCRLPYDLVDAGGRLIQSARHFLSLKDLNRTLQLEQLMDAGVSSFKIEGRLKDISYVKNITAWYREQIDRILDKRPEYIRASSGKSEFTFRPLPEKSFNRGFTPFYLSGRSKDVTAFDTPKSLGEPIGRVKEIKGNHFTVAGLHGELNNGDGLVFFNKVGQLDGFRVNRAEENRVFPLEMPHILPKTPLYRNYDNAFEKQLSKPTAIRKIGVKIEFTENNFGFTLCMTDETGASAMVCEPAIKEPAKKDQRENIISQLSKLGNTPYTLLSIEVELPGSVFVPSSLLSTMRRKAIEKLTSVRGIRYKKELRKQAETAVFPKKQLTYLGNTSNSLSQSFYTTHGVENISPAFEIKPETNVPLMFTKHCIRYSLGYCPVYDKQKLPFSEPLYLQRKDMRLRLEFDCRNCMMKIYSEPKSD